MSQTVTVRLPDDTAAWLKTSARRTGRSVSELGATLFEEARRTSEFSEIEFRTINGERVACVKGHLQVWQVIEVAQGLGMDVEKTASHFRWPVWRARAALNYYEAFPPEIDDAIQDNRSLGYDNLKRILPAVQLSEVGVKPGGSDPDR